MSEKKCCKTAYQKGIDQGKTGEAWRRGYNAGHDEAIQEVVESLKNLRDNRIENGCLCGCDRVLDNAIAVITTKHDETKK